MFGVSAAVALHNMPGSVAPGRVYVHPRGAVMGASSAFDVTLTGSGGHAARMPSRGGEAGRTPPPPAASVPDGFANGGTGVAAGHGAAPAIPPTTDVLVAGAALITAGTDLVTTTLPAGSLPTVLAWTRVVPSTSAYNVRPRSVSLGGTVLPTRVPDLHTAAYDFDDGAIGGGIAFWVRLVEAFDEAVARAD
ncbi:hypothetical protein I4F81_005636 [Pyropia yezoensis]|uniref:Uncharacterized protein n=1 Tax=Pyropia yezoensis TaxID=2788 RepID=A0ACC3BYU1_PYRYE|nr:hypothetical protein I4F81_005636 [Neopyropia yezoensis]